MKTKLIAAALLCYSLHAAPEAAVEIDHLSLATLMIYDGKYDQAASELALVDRKLPSFDLAKYHTTQGVLQTKLENHQGAIENYKAAIEATKTKVYEAPKIHQAREHLFSIGSDPKEQPKAEPFNPEALRQEQLEKLYIYLSQSYYKVKAYQESVDALDQAGEPGRDKASLYTFRADCYWKLEKHSEALNALNIGYERFKDPTLLKQKYYYYADLTLYHSAIETAKRYMQHVGIKEEEYLSIAQMLMGANQHLEAIKILEEAKLHFPKNPKFSLLLSHAYLKNSMLYSGAAAMEYSTHFDPTSLKDSVELYRRVKHYPHAIYLNSSQVDPVEKIKQNIAIFIEREEFEKVIGLLDGLKRYNMLSDDNIRYALAYAYYMSQDYDSAESHLKKINDSALFEKATVIRKNIEQCKDNSMECI